ncbi:MAG: hypothetical protein NT173_14440, partial [Opitutales bacterium]|nr:hypothetical protein [Opitutales bacterium]
MIPSSSSLRPPAMTWSKLTRRLLAGGALALAALLPAQTSASHVEASLVAAPASIQPGQPFTVALR